MTYHMAILSKVGKDMGKVLSSFTSEEMNEIVEKSAENPSHYWITVWNKYTELKKEGAL